MTIGDTYADVLYTGSSPCDYISSSTLKVALKNKKYTRKDQPRNCRGTLCLLTRPPVLCGDVWPKIKNTALLQNVSSVPQCSRLDPSLRGAFEPSGQNIERGYIIGRRVARQRLRSVDSGAPEGGCSNDEASARREGFFGFVFFFCGIQRPLQSIVWHYCSPLAAIM